MARTTQIGIAIWTAKLGFSEGDKYRCFKIYRTMMQAQCASLSFVKEREPCINQSVPDSINEPHSHSSLRSEHVGHVVVVPDKDDSACKEQAERCSACQSTPFQGLSNCFFPFWHSIGGLPQCEDCHAHPTFNLPGSSNFGPSGYNHGRYDQGCKFHSACSLTKSIAALYISPLDLIIVMLLYNLDSGFGNGLLSLLPRLDLHPYIQC